MFHPVMAYPFFYIEPADISSGIVQLNEETSKHIVQVLRMTRDEFIQLTDGKGNLYTCKIIDDHRKKCIVRIEEKGFTESRPVKITIAISLIKNNTRFEWFLEKATEIGVFAIIPLLCERTEKQNFRAERMRSILISAMLQSQQTWLPLLGEPARYEHYLISTPVSKRFIAHCAEDKKTDLAKIILDDPGEKLILIGPEGDFSKNEILLALENKFVPVALGNSRLRTETAGLVAATLLCNL